VKLCVLPVEIKVMSVNSVGMQLLLTFVPELINEVVKHILTMLLMIKLHRCRQDLGALNHMIGGNADSLLD
jgi:hypothetical protein